MKPAAFEYHQPRRIEEALDMLAKLDDSKLLAGGQSLGPMLNFRFLMPEHVIDINRIPELQQIRFLEDGSIRIGAMARQYMLEKDSGLRTVLPIMADTLKWVGHYATRNRGTIGGSLSHLDPSAELPGLCALLDATLTVRSDTSAREISIHDWSQGFMQANLEEDELLTDIVISPWKQAHGHGFIEMSRRHGDFAIAGASCLMALDANRKIQRLAISVIGVANGPVRLKASEQALCGQAFSDEAISVAAAELNGQSALGDAHYSSSFRKRIAQTMVKRAMRMAYEDAVLKETQS
jgi:carbon-monoxide dehydrogenase medium subunit